MWDASKTDAVARRFGASEKPFAADALAAVVRELDAYGARWVDARRTSCEATHLRGEQPEETFALRAACFDRRLDEVEALAELFAAANATVVEHAAAPRASSRRWRREPSAALTMQPIPPADPEVRTRVGRCGGASTRRAPCSTPGSDDGGLAVADEGVKAREGGGHLPVTAEALYLQGALREQIFDSKGAEAALYEAAAAAEAGRHDKVAAEAWALLVSVVGYKQARPEAGHVLAHPARAAILRTGEAPELAAPLENNLGTLAWLEGHYPEALSHYARAIALWERSRGREHPSVADALNNRVGPLEPGPLRRRRRVARTSGRSAELWARRVVAKLPQQPAQPFQPGAGERPLTTGAVAIQESALGREHPAMANSLNLARALSEGRTSRRWTPSRAPSPSATEPTGRAPGHRQFEDQPGHGVQALGRRRRP